MKPLAIKIQEKLGIYATPETDINEAVTALNCLDWADQPEETINSINNYCTEIEKLSANDLKSIFKDWDKDQLQAATVVVANICSWIRGVVEVTADDLDDTEGYLSSIDEGDDWSGLENVVDSSNAEGAFDKLNIESEEDKWDFVGDIAKKWNDICKKALRTKWS